MAALSADEIQDIVRTHGWQPGEREAMLDDMAERAALDDDLGAVHAEVKPAAEQSAPAHKLERESAMTTNTDRWAAFVRREVATARKASEKSLLGAVADVLLEERAKVEVELRVLRQELAALKTEVADLRGAERSPHLRAV